MKRKNKTNLLGNLRKKFHEITNWNYTEVVIVKPQINLESYNYLSRHLVKINRVFKGTLIITLNKTEYKGEYIYTAVISLKVIK